MVQSSKEKVQKQAKGKQIVNFLTLDQTALLVVPGIGVAKTFFPANNHKNPLPGRKRVFMVVFAALKGKLPGAGEHPPNPKL
ncbi:hypothetical protein [Cnuella takakiae]|uniref:hypothetical protein n=1 Tax=Cnuella takakiae TaxID=1302690 RepID=UPI001160CF76|nr:hypothetical protein [Cnuella takakiae]